MTKKQLQGVYARYLRSEDCELWNVYNSFSSYKAVAFNWCKDMQRKDKGTRGRIIGYNCTAFTYGYTFEDKETGELRFRFITKDNVYTLDNLGAIA